MPLSGKRKPSNSSLKWSKGVQEREYEMKQEVERARITQEQVVQEREIEMNRDIQVARVQQEQIVAEREIEKKPHR